MMILEKLTNDYDLSAFDCGDLDLNEFLRCDALQFANARIANTFVLIDGNNIVAYFCLLNDKITQQEAANNRWKKLKKTFPDEKRFSSYPAIKIGRFAVDRLYKGKNIGTILMEKLKDMLNENRNFSAFRYITVDAYLSAIGFYEKNEFQVLSSETAEAHTRLMFFDVKTLK